jgi:hypothetical protein
VGDDGDRDDSISLGGPMPWFSMGLWLTAEDLDPDEVTRLLGVEPDLTRRRGVRWPLPDPGGMSSPLRLSSVPAHLGVWAIRLHPERAPGCDVEAAIARVLDRLVAAAPDAWRRARAGATARVSVALTLDAYNRGFGLGPALLRRAAELDLELDFDVYEGPDDTERRRTRARMGELGRELGDNFQLTPPQPEPGNAEPEA